MIQPEGERLCILCPSNSTITELQGNVFHAVQLYTLYRDFLEYCTIHLELQIQNTTYAIPAHYILSECYEPSDTFIVTFVENQTFQTRQSIHMPYQTKSDITQLKHSQTQTLSQNIIFNTLNPPLPTHNLNLSTANNTNSDAFDDGKSNISDIQKWVSNYVYTRGTLHAIYQAQYKQFMGELQSQFPNSIPNSIPMSRYLYQ